MITLAYAGKTVSGSLIYWAGESSRAGQANAAIEESSDGRLESQRGS
jgi:hypothetical protein